MTVRKNFTKLGIMIEDTEGLYKAPATDTDFIETLEDGATIEQSKEKIERNVMSGNRIRKNFRLGKETASGNTPLEAKAGDTPGTAPKYTELHEAAGMGKSGLAARVTSGTSHTTTLINVASTTGLVAGDIVLVKESELSANADHISPIASIVSNTSITLLIPASNAFTDNVEIEASVILRLDESVNKTVSVTKIYEGDEKEQRLTGGRVSNIQLQNWTTGQTPQWLCDLVGLGVNKVLNSSAFSPEYDDGQPPLILNSCIFKNTSQLEINEFTMAIGNPVTIKSSTCSSNGNVSSRGTGKNIISGSFNPYASQNAVQFKLDEDEYSVFGYAYNPTANDGEKSQVIAFYIPKVKSDTSVDADVDGLLTNAVTFEATPDDYTDSIVIALI